MPTSPRSDVVPLRKETKRRLDALRGSATYDALLRALLDAAPADEVRARLGPAPRAVEARERPPEKQLLVAELAARRWRAWEQEGRIARRGPRLYAWRPATPTDREVKYAIGRRGLSP